MAPAPDDPSGATEPDTEVIDPSGGVTPALSDEQAPDAHGARRVKVRRRLVLVLTVLACFGLLVSSLAVWSHRLLLNTDAWVATVGPLADDPAITDAVATQLTDEIFTLVNPEQLAKNALPDKADFLAAPLTDALHGFVDTKSKELLQTQQFKDFWVNANRIIHENLVKLLRGETVAGFTVNNGEITLNLLPLLSKTMIWITDKAPRVFGDVTIPVITSDMPPDQARAALQAVFPVTLPPDFGVYTVFKSAELGAAQQAVKLFDRLVVLIVIVTAALVVASVVLSLNRRRTLVTLGVGTVLVMLITDALVRSMEKLVTGLITGTEERHAAEATISTLLEDLRSITHWLIAIGVVLVLGAFFSGDSRLARAVRQGLARAAGRLPVSAANAPTSVLPVLTRYASLFQLGGVVVAAIALVAIDTTIWGLLLILALLGAYELFVYAVTRVPPGESDGSLGGPATAAGVAAAD